MNDDNNPGFLSRILIIVITVVGLISFWWLRSIWILAFASIVIAVGISVPAKWLQQHGFGRGLAVAISAISVVVGAVAVMLLLVLPISTEVGRAIESAPEAIDSAARLYDEWRTAVPLLQNVLPERESSAILIQLGELAANVDLSTVQQSLAAVFQAGSTVLPSLIKGLGTFLAVLANLLFVVFIAIFFLIEPMSYVKASLYITPQKFHTRVLGIWMELYVTLSAWITTQFLAISITMALVWFVLGFILNIPGALTIALFAGFATFIPNLGAILPIIPIVFFILVSDSTNQSTQLLQAIPAYLAIQFVEGSIITPRLMKAQLDIPSGALMLFQVVSASVFGALGLIFAVPILATIITLVREIFSYELLGLRNSRLDIIALDAEGTMALRQRPPDGEDLTSYSDLDGDEEGRGSLYASIGSLAQEFGKIRLFSRRPTTDSKIDEASRVVVEEEIPKQAVLHGTPPIKVDLDAIESNDLNEGASIETNKV